MTGEDMLSAAEARLGTYGRFSNTPGPGTVSALLGALKDPHKKMKYVHVAGTNGKGSTTAMIASALTSAGLRTGMYTSPSVEKLTERVCIDMVPADDGVFAGALNRAMDAADSLELAPAQFDILTAAAFLVFAEAGCEIAAVEVGLGGRLDATNVIDAPEAAVITSISLDHVAQLGSDLGTIAREKCGILKGCCPVVSYPKQEEQARSAIADASAQAGCELTVPDLGALEILELSPGGSRFVYRGREYAVTMPGRHFVYNAVTAIETMELLRKGGWPLRDEDIVRGVAAAPLTGRLQTVCTEPTVLVDGAHNPDAAEKLCEAMGELFAGRRVITVMGMFSDKDCRATVGKIAAMSDVFIATRPRGSRAIDALKVWEYAAGTAKNAFVCPSPRGALVQAMSFWRPGDVILCCGSFALAAEVRKTVAKFAAYISDFIK